MKLLIQNKISHYDRVIFVLSVIFGYAALLSPKNFRLVALFDLLPLVWLVSLPFIERVS